MSLKTHCISANREQRFALYSKYIKELLLLSGEPSSNSHIFPLVEMASALWKRALFPQLEKIIIGHKWIRMPRLHTLLERLLSPSIRDLAIYFPLPDPSMFRRYFNLFACHSNTLTKLSFRVEGWADSSQSIKSAESLQASLESIRSSPRGTQEKPQ